jgi:hypothetical protein
MLIFYGKMEEVEETVGEIESEIGLLAGYLLPLLRFLRWI